MQPTLEEQVAAIVSDTNDFYNVEEDKDGHRIAHVNGYIYCAGSDAYHKNGKRIYRGVEYSGYYWSPIDARNYVPEEGCSYESLDDELIEWCNQNIADLNLRECAEYWLDFAEGATCFPRHEIDDTTPLGGWYYDAPADYNIAEDVEIVKKWLASL